MSNTDDHESYRNPLTFRYASREMINNFGEKRRVILWRKLWIWLAEAQQMLGFDIKDNQLEEMRQKCEDVDFETAAVEEKARRHDVMAHVYTYAAACPNASPIIHLGATSCYVGDNADLIILRDALDFLLPKLARCIERLAKQAEKHKNLICLGRTHLQPAQPTTLGRRMCMWIQDLLIDLENFEHLKNEKFRFRGIKGAVGTQASFLDLFGGDYEKVIKLDQIVSAKAGFSKIWQVTGQTYPRKFDADFVNVMASLGATVHKICTDIRLLSSFCEIEEPFESEQIGSSAMPYKRNPIRCERACALARYLTNSSGYCLSTASVQWLERSLDDSAIRRIVLPESCMAADACLILLQNMFEGLVVYPKVIETNLNAELPFMAAERILIAMVSRASANRQECHERLRIHGHAAASDIKLHGLANSLMARLKGDEYFQSIHDELDTILDPVNFIGRAPQQVEHYLKTEVYAALKPYEHALAGKSNIHV